MERFTHLGRTIDPRYPSNVFAVAVAAIMALLALVMGGSASGWGTPFSVGLASFLSWALARELDPDRTITAGVAAMGGGLVALIHPAAAPGAIYLLMVTARITVRSTGLAPKAGDLIVQSVAAALLATSVAGWIGGMAVSLAMVRDVTLPRPAPGRQLWWGAVTGVVVTVVISLSDVLGAWSAPGVGAWGIVALGAVGAVFLAAPESPSSRTDYTDALLDPIRLRTARVVVTGATALTAAVAGANGIRALAPVWITLAAGGLFRLITRNPDRSAVEGPSEA